jgi:hypothetical protein
MMRLDFLGLLVLKLLNGKEKMYGIDQRVINSDDHHMLFVSTEFFNDQRETGEDTFHSKIIGKFLKSLTSVSCHFLIKTLKCTKYLSYGMLVRSAFYFLSSVS